MKLFDVYPLFDITPVKAKDVYVFDENNTKYLDLYGGHAVISIGHSHPDYVKNISEQVGKLGFYSNSIQNPLQKELASKLGKLSGCNEYELFLCNSGAEANENALKLASFHTNKKKVIAFKNSFHGRTSAAVAATDNPKIVAPINAQQKVEFLELGDLDGLNSILERGDVCAVIIETIQGIGGLDEVSTQVYQGISKLCKQYGATLNCRRNSVWFWKNGRFLCFSKTWCNSRYYIDGKRHGKWLPYWWYFNSSKHQSLGRIIGNYVWWQSFGLCSFHNSFGCFGKGEFNAKCKRNLKLFH